MTDIECMIKILILLIPILLLALTPFDSPKPNWFDTSIYNTVESSENKKASKNSEVKCRYVCDKRVYKEQQISDAVSFYRSSKNYKFILNID